MFNYKKPDKIRVVFEEAAKNKLQGLNSSLFTSPDFLNSLIVVLLRFRNSNIAIVAHVEVMFHQVRVKPSDCDSLQFLWADRTLGKFKGRNISGASTYFFKRRSKKEGNIKNSCFYN